MTKVVSRVSAHRKAKSLLPPLYGVVAALLVVAIFQAPYLLAQAHRLWYQPPAVDQGVVTDQSGVTRTSDPAQPVFDVARSQDPRILISSIGVDAPVVFGMQSVAEGDVQLALQSGVLHYGATAMPGQMGNSVYLGHSSGAAWRPGDYKWVFTQLEKIKIGDIVSVEYQGIKYSYRVYETWVTAPTDLSVLQPTDVPVVTLITCTPVGTANNRFIVRGLQISPAPSAAVAPDASTSAPQPSVLPGI